VAPFAAPRPGYMAEHSRAADVNGTVVTPCSAVTGNSQIGSGRDLFELAVPHVFSLAQTSIAGGTIQVP
jgi:hypothetical protein